MLYRRGPEWPLSLATPKGKQGTAQVLRRTFAGFGDRPALSAGFIGRRLDQRQVRRRLRGGEHALVSRASGAWTKAPWPGRCCPG